MILERERPPKLHVEPSGVDDLVHHDHRREDPVSEHLPLALAVGVRQLVERELVAVPESRAVLLRRAVNEVMAPRVVDEVALLVWPAVQEDRGFLAAAGEARRREVIVFRGGRSAMSRCHFCDIL